MTLSVVPFHENGEVIVFDSDARDYLRSPVGRPRVFFDEATARRLLPELTGSQLTPRTQNARARRLGVKAGQ